MSRFIIFNFQMHILENIEDITQYFYVIPLCLNRSQNIFYSQQVCKSIPRILKSIRPC